MACRRARDILEDGDRIAFGLWISIGDPAIVEMAANAGYDFVNLDMEHTSLGLSTIENMLRAASACGISGFVRPPESNPKTILRVVEIGPDGIVIPHVRNAEEARQVVMAAKYAPLGDRGISASTRAARYGSEPSFVSYAERINRDLIIYLQIEEMSAVDDIEAIASVDGVDVCGIAPADLSRSAGVMGAKNDPGVGKIVSEVAQKIKRVGKAKLACPFMHPNFEVDLAGLKSLNAKMSNHSSDVKVIAAGFKENMRRVHPTT